LGDEIDACLELLAELFDPFVKALKGSFPYMDREIGCVQGAGQLDVPKPVGLKWVSLGGRIRSRNETVGRVDKRFCCSGMKILPSESGDDDSGTTRLPWLPQSPTFPSGKGHEILGVLCIVVELEINTVGNSVHVEKDRRNFC
jgi:hypothetical protein